MADRNYSRFDIEVRFELFWSMFLDRTLEKHFYLHARPAGLLHIAEGDCISLKLETMGYRVVHKWMES